MVGVSDAHACASEPVEPAAAVLARLEAFGSEVLIEAMNRPVQSVQLINGRLYLPGLIEQARVSRLSRWSNGWAMTPTISRCSSSSPTVRGIRCW